MKKNLIIALVVIMALVVASFSLYGYLNGLRTESVHQETALNAQYLANQNYLSAFLSGFYEQLGIAKYKSEKLNEIITDYVKGRSFAQGGKSERAGFINVVVEAVPNIGKLDILDKMMDYVAAQREGYRAAQDKQLDMLRHYDDWRQDGYVQSFVVAKIIGVPTRRLQASIGIELTRGAEAREQMYRIVLASQARDAYRTGTMEPLNVPTKP